MALILAGETSSTALTPQSGSFNLYFTASGAAYLKNSSGAVVLLGVNPPYANTPTITGSANSYTYSGTLLGGVYLGVNLTVTGAVTITIPASTGSYYPLTVADIAQVAGAHNYTITPVSGSIIGGSTLYVNGQSITYIDTANGWVAQ